MNRQDCCCVAESEEVSPCALGETSTWMGEGSCLIEKEFSTWSDKCR